MATTRRATVRRGDNADASVWIQPEGGSAIALRLPDSLPAAAWRWNYSLHNRSRWTGRSDALERQRQDIAKLAADLGLSNERLAVIARAGLAEVSIPWRSEDQDWALRILPWEYLLAAATREHRVGLNADFTVVRQLRRATPKRVANQAVLLYVQSAPPGVASLNFDFRDEERLAMQAANALCLRFELLKNPDVAALRAGVLAHKPKVIHVTGVDVHQGRHLRDGNAPGEEIERPAREDGMLMLGTNGTEAEVSAAELASALCVGRSRPDVVCFNLHNSASRIAALTVAQGAGAAIGFQDRFDDALAERFFSTLYRGLALSQHDLTAAFRFAWQQVRESKRPLTGTGLVLWSGTGRKESEPRPGDSASAAARIGQQWRAASNRSVTAESALVDLAVEIKEVQELNYSMLHNGRPLFHSFRIVKRGPEPREAPTTQSSAGLVPSERSSCPIDIGEVPGIEIDVTLHLGADSACYRERVTLPATANSIDIAHRVRVSLAGSLGRALRESLRTSLLVEVRFAETVLFRETRWVSLLAVDEWEDSDLNRKWLPSFVLPRDPAVAKIIKHAQRYLQALCDDPTQGFDGYQSVGSAGDGNDFVNVDRQVQAIWCALLYETPLSYINPPPCFTDASQRLRTPSDILHEGHGTCIDLALLLAACCEYIDVYPTVVLLKDHAFPCYWRSSADFENFAVARSAAVQPSGSNVDAGVAGAAQADSWCFLREHYREVMGEIAAGRLVAIESTGLCWRHSFATACEQGHANLSRRSQFDSMLDIRAARIDRNRVTPLPLLQGENNR